MNFFAVPNSHMSHYFGVQAKGKKVHLIPATLLVKDLVVSYIELTTVHQKLGHTHYDCSIAQTPHDLVEVNLVKSK